MLLLELFHEHTAPLTAEQLITFEFSAGVMYITAAAAAAVAVDVPLKEDVADLKAGPAEDVNTTDRDGAPIGIVETSR